ncbi:MAG: hypothetical protein AAFP17_08360 [Pseudomonadota bacterium]
MKLGAIGVAMTLAFLPMTASAIIIDFEGEQSDALQTVPLTSFTEDGLTFDLTFTGPNAGPAIFDTTCSDFGAPGAGAACNGDDDLLPIAGQPVSAVDFNGGIAGNVLILQESGSAIPDDQAPGGTITFTSNAANPAFFLNSFWAIDDGMFTIMAGGESASVNNGSGAAAENAEGQAIFTTPVLINPGESFTLTFSGSGAIDNLSVTPVPVPPAALLLVGALGGLAVMRRKRRSES